MIAVRVDEVDRDGGRSDARDRRPSGRRRDPRLGRRTRVAMVRQWRHATGKALLEIPAGTLEPDEKPNETARRELSEEVGLAAARWMTGPRFYTAPGFCTELMHIYLATGLSEATADGDEDEELEPSWMSLDEALAAIDDGRIVDAKTMVGIGWLARRLRYGSRRDGHRTERP